MPRPAVIRYAGLTGSVLLAVAAARNGADWPWQPTMTARTILAGDDGVLTPVCWLAGTLLLIFAWVLGRRVVPSARWAYVTAGLWAAPLLVVLPMGSYDVYSYACQGWALAAGHDPYSAGVQALGCPWAYAVSPTWLDSPAPYGPVFLLLAAVAAKTGSLVGALIVLRLIAVLGVVLIAVSLPALARHVPLEKAVWLVLACPLVPIHLISGAHNDAVMVGLLVAALAVRKPVAAGVLIGLAIGVKATAIVVLPFALLLFMDRKIKFVGGAVAAVGLASLLGVGWVKSLAGSGVSVQWTSPSTAIGMTVELITGFDAVPITRILGIIGLVAVLAVLWWRSRTGDPLLGAGLALAATVVLAPVFHPWYLTWPLAVLAATLRRDTLWLVVPCAVASALCLPDGYNLALATKAQGAIAMTILVVVIAVRSLKRPKAEA